MHKWHPAPASQRLPALLLSQPPMPDPSGVPCASGDAACYCNYVKRDGFFPDVGSGCRVGGAGRVDTVVLELATIHPAQNRTTSSKGCSSCCSCFASKGSAIPTAVYALPIHATHGRPAFHAACSACPCFACSPSCLCALPLPSPQRFYMCSQGLAFLDKCPSDALLYNPDIMACDYADLVTCPSDPSDDPDAGGDNNPPTSPPAAPPSPSNVRTPSPSPPVPKPQKPWPQCGIRNAACFCRDKPDGIYPNTANKCRCGLWLFWGARWPLSNTWWLRGLGRHDKAQ